MHAFVAIAYEYEGISLSFHRNMNISNAHVSTPWDVSSTSTINEHDGYFRITTSSSAHISQENDQVVTYVSIAIAVVVVVVAITLIVFWFTKQSCRTSSIRKVNPSLHPSNNKAYPDIGFIGEHHVPNRFASIRVVDSIPIPSEHGQIFAESKHQPPTMVSTTEGETQGAVLAKNVSPALRRLQKENLVQRSLMILQQSHNVKYTNDDIVKQAADGLTSEAKIQKKAKKKALKKLKRLRKMKRKAAKQRAQQRAEAKNV